MCTIVKQVCEVLGGILLPRYIFFPQNQQVQDQIDGFRDCAVFPHRVAPLDGGRVPIIAPLQSPEDYVNQKGFHVVTLQGLVDSSYCFVDIFVGWPAKVHVVRIFQSSPWFSHCCARTFLPL